MAKKVEDVFTPRSQNVNDNSYVKRENVIRELDRAFRGSKNIIVHGESGTGKSWLYKRYFLDNKVNYLTANLANSSRMGSINEELKNVVEREKKYIKTGKKTNNEVSLTGSVETTGLSKLIAKLKGAIGLKRNKTNEYRAAITEPFELCLKYLNDKANRGVTSVLVLDNFESIQKDAKIQKELADLILLLDDERYGQYNVKLLIVGTPRDIMYYFTKIDSTASVSNRLHEVQEVSKMTRNEAEQLFKKGFIDELKYEIHDYKEIMEHVLWITDRIPQRLQEYCEILGYVGEDERRLKAVHIQEADQQWLKDSLSLSYTVIERVMNSRNTKVGRKNQILYCLGRIESNEIKLNDVESHIHIEFPNSTDGVAINPSQNLASLASEEEPIIKKTPKGNSYFFTDPKYKLCLRVMLKKNNETVEKVEIASI